MKSGQREIDLSVPAETAWAALVAPGLRDWYYRLTPQGDFAPGGHIRWVDVAGNPAEETDVLAVGPPHRMEMTTRYVFAPYLAAFEPHRIEWTLTPTPGGCSVRLSWDAEDQVSAMYEADAHNQLAALRLAVDPVAQSEIARLDSIGEVRVTDVTPERIDDYLHFFDEDAFRAYPAWQSCYCMETHRTQSDEEWLARTADENRGDMVEMIKQSKVTALLAYSDGKPVGWCNYGETTALSGVMQRFNLEPPDHQGVGSVACFVIAAPYRGHGIGTSLLDAAIERLRERGLKAVEGYPARKEDSAEGNYRGPMAMFLRAGFEPYRDLGRNVIVRKTL